MICAVLCVNSGYLGYPLAVALLGRDQLPDAVLYDVLVTATSLMLGAFGVGAAFGTRAGRDHAIARSRFSLATRSSTRRSPASSPLPPWPRRR